MLPPRTLLVVAAAATACQPPTPEWRPAAEPSTLGEVVYEIIHTNVGQTEACPGERQTVLEDVRDDFVLHFDETVSVETATGLPESVESTLLPLVDDGAVPALTDNAAAVMALLVDDTLDPDRQALAEALAFAQGRSVLSGRHLASLGERIVDADDAAESLHAAAVLAGADDQGTPLATALLGVVRTRIDRFSQPSGCAGLTVAGINDTLLHTTTFDPSLDFGPAAWAVAADELGNPRVAIDPNTGTLYAPFVDHDGDGAADVNGEGVPVDGGGAAIYLAPFGDGARRDSYGRALAPDGWPIYAYFDAKRTGFSVLIQFLGEAVVDDFHHHLVAVGTTVMGAQIPCPEGPAGCLTYPVDDHPVADLAFAVLEDLRYERVATLLETWDVVLQNEPEVAESVLVALGQALEALDQGGIRLTDGDLIDLFMEAMPLFADVFARDNSGDESTARLLIDVVHDLGDTARDLPEELQVTMEYVVLDKEDACSAAPPDLDASTPVDFEQPRYYEIPGSGWIDNRSALEQEIELLSDVDCGSVPFTGGKSVARVVLEVMADSSPETACDIINIVLGIMELPVIGTVSEWLFGLTTGCPDEALQDLEAMDALAKSGALDALLPIANAFVQRDQTETLLDIFHLLAADLRKDESADPDHSTLRRALPTLATVMRSGAADALFDLDDILATVDAVDGSGTMADVVIDSFEYVTDDTGFVRTRFGVAANTSLALEMLGPYREILTRLDAAGETEHLDALINHFFGYLRRTTVDDRGTADPTDDRVILADRRLMPVYEGLLAFASQSFDFTEAQRECYFDYFQDEVDLFLTSPDFATSLRLLQIYGASPDSGVLDATLYRWLTPQAAEADDVFGALMQVLTALVQTPADALEAQALYRFAVAALGVLDGPGIMSALDRLLVEDPNATLLTVVRAAMDHGALGREQAALEFFGELFIDVVSVDEAHACADVDRRWTVADAEAAVTTMVDFLGDDDYGIGAIYDLIALRSGP